MSKLFDYEVPKCEEEAHIFAINLLIPKKRLVAFINKGGQTISSCAGHFQVSKGEIRKALKIYNLIEEGAEGGER